MSRHWDFRKDYARSSRPRRRRRGVGRFGGGEIRLVLVIGVTLGLVSQLGSFGQFGSGAPPIASVFAGGGEAATGGAATGDAVTIVSNSVRIVDGDTFVHRGERIRIADIDTPELRSDCAAEVRLARSAKARLATLLAQGPFELHRIGRDRDRYGRALRIVVRDGRSIGDRLVAEGLARTWSGRREPWC